MIRQVKESLAKFRRQLGRVFDDNPDTVQWHNITDWVIVSMVVLSSAEIFISTFSVSPGTARILNAINQFTLWFFVVEVTLRIWAAPETDPRYRGIVGRIKYCFTFYGFIDFVSTYPFLIQYLVPIPMSALKALRTARIIRILRITRYAKSFDMIYLAIRNKRNELIVSMQFLLIITFLLSLVLFIYEHEVQPQIYDNGFSSVVWAFAQYIGDPGKFAETPPVTLPGKIIACIVGVLGIAIFAVPAGILGAGFTETIEKETRREQIIENHGKLRKSFERQLDRPTGYRVVPFFRTLVDIQANIRLSVDDILETVDTMPGFRLVNLATTIPFDKNPQDRLAVEHFAINRPYGQLIDRGSRVTIVSPSSMIDAGVGIFSYYLAAIGGFNYISREKGERTPYQSFYLPRQPYGEELQAYNADLQRLMAHSGAWSFTILAASGANEPEYDTQVHFGIGGAKGDEATHIPTSSIVDTERYKSLFTAFSETLQRKFGLSADQGRYHNTAHPKIWFRQMQLPADANHVVMRFAWSIMLWSNDRLAVAKALADEINRTILHRPTPPASKELTARELGF